MQAWTPETLRQQSEALEPASSREILGWGLETFGSDLVMATGFGLSGIVLAHQLAAIAPEATVFYLETDLLFPETAALRDRLAERLGLTFTPVHSGVTLERQYAEHGPDLWARNPDQCCFIRKVLPLRRFLADKGAWVSGLRRDQSPARAHTEVVAWDTTNGLVKVNPLATWTQAAVWRYIHRHALPYNPLLDEGYASVGCMPCTRPVAPGEDARAGRWSGFAKTECGIHVQPKAA
jgi:phosphoadenosine phosphosulfate reductase